MPYRDFAVEYPPGALPVFALPALGHRGFDTFRVRFQALMALLGEGMIVCVAIAMLALGAGEEAARCATLGFVALAPLAARPGRSDALRPLAGGADRSCAGRARLGPPPARARRARRRGRGEALPGRAGSARGRLRLAARGRREALVCAAVLAGRGRGSSSSRSSCCRPRGLWHSFSGQASRPLQIESLGAGLLLVAHQLFGTGVTMESSHGSQNLVGSAPDALAAAQSVLQVVGARRGLDPVRARAGHP